MAAKKLFGRVFWVTAVIGMAALAILAGIRMERNTVIQTVEYSGAVYTQVEELDRTFESPVGLHPDSVRFMMVIDSVRALPWVKDAGVRVEANGRMMIDLVERTPLALIIQGSHFTYVDENGVRMPVRPGIADNVPLLHGFPAGPVEEQLEGEAFKQVSRFLRAARQNDLAWITISEVAWSPDEGVIALSQENGVKLLFGSGDFDEKIGYWQAFYREVIRESGIRNFTSVDLRFRNQIVTRKG